MKGVACMANDILLDKFAEEDAGISVAGWIRFGVATLLMVGIVVSLFFPFVVKYKVEVINEDGVVVDNETEVDFNGVDVLLSTFDILFDKESDNNFTTYLVNAQPMNVGSDFTRITLSRIFPFALLLFLVLFLADYVYMIVKIFKEKLKRGVNTFSILQLVTALTVLLAALLLQIVFGAVKAPGVGIIVLAAVAVLAVAYQPIAGEHFPEKE
jgi:drug/metabolite transporter (DMT)-like permease